MTDPATVAAAAERIVDRVFTLLNGGRAVRVLVIADHDGKHDGGYDEGAFRHAVTQELATLAAGPPPEVRCNVCRDNGWVCCCGKPLDGGHDHNTCGPPILCDVCENAQPPPEVFRAALRRELAEAKEKAERYRAALFSDRQYDEIEAVTAERDAARRELAAWKQACKDSDWVSEMCYDRIRREAERLMKE